MKFRPAREKATQKQSHEEITKNRRIVCEQCVNKKTAIGVNYCGLCKCVIKIKTQLPKAKCPIGKW